MIDRLKLIKNEYDLIIIGGGIYGATLLWEATQRGLSAILVEKNDFCSATSANSLKIIHGGLRYLQSFDLKRIRESFIEQTKLLRVAPHLVQPLPCIIPTYHQIKNSKFSMFVAFKLYDLTCLGSKSTNNPSMPSNKILSKNELYTLIPGIDFSDITGGALWHDALNYNSERLVLEFILSAKDHGADAFNYLEFKDVIIAKGRVIGIQAFDKLSEQKLDICGKVVINAAGPWINNVCNGSDYYQKQEQFSFAKAVNLIIQRKFSDVAFGLRDFNIPIDDYFQKNRYVFFVPWRGATMVGTWYFNNSSSPDEVSLTQAEYFKCIGHVQRLLPQFEIDEEDVCFVHSGLVPIDIDDGGRRFELKGNYLIIDHHHHYNHPDGFISVLGVKYTTARNVSGKVLDLISKKLNRKLCLSDFEDQPLAGGKINDILNFIREKTKSNNHKLPKAVVRHLALNYGSNYDKIEKMINDDEKLGELIPGSDEAIRAELLYCIRNEFAYHLTDLLIRRTDIGSLRKPKIETIDYCSEFMAREMGWSALQKQDEIDSLINFYNRFPVN